MRCCYTRCVPRVFPFRGLVYDPAIVGRLELVTAPPYDVISEARRREFQAGSPFSVVHLDLAAERDNPVARYARAARLLERWESDGAIVRRPEETYFAYEMRFRLDGQPRRVRGLCCAMELEDWGGGIVPHERTMPGPIEDRLELLRATRTHLSAVYGTIRGPNGPLADLLESAASPAPIASLVDEQGVEHRLWPVAAIEPVPAWLVDEPLMIADGHHRYTTALQYRNERHAADGPGPWDRMLTFVVDAGAERVPVLPFHRIQLGGDVPTGGSPVSGLDRLLAALSDDDLVIGLVSRESGELRHRTLSLRGEPPAVRGLHHEILDRAAPEGALRFTPDAAEAEAAVRSGEALAAWFLPPTTPDRIRKVVERGERLPQKSTFFWPKPRTGVVMMPLDPG